MIIENFVKDDITKSAVRDALSLLHKINFFGVMLEVAAERSIIQPSHNPIDTSALSHAWHAGYVECLRDIFNFPQKYFEPASEQPQAPTVTFNAPDILLKRNDITDDEYKQLTGKYPDRRAKSSTDE